MNSKNISDSKTSAYLQPLIFSKYNKIASDLKAVNLGQGFPDFAPADFLIKSMNKSINDGNYQYTNGKGIPKLVNVIAKKWGEIYNRKIDPNTEVLCSNGAVAALYAAFTAFTEPGDEAITLEPYFNCYDPPVEFCGGKLMGVPLIPPKNRERKEYENVSNWKKGDCDDWAIDYEALKKAINEKTRFLILNSPNNPTGKVISYEEYEQIVKLVEKFPRIILIADEVYEFHLFSDRYEDLPRLQKLEGVWNRTISIHSAGKIFSATGLRLGFTIGPEPLVSKMFPILQYSNFCIFEPIQDAYADSFVEAEKPFQGFDNYYKWIKDYFRKLRNKLIEGLAKATSFDVQIYLPEGGFFIVCDISKLKTPENKYVVEGEEDIRSSYTKDKNYTLNLAHEKGLVVIPCSSLYTKEHAKANENFIRLAFCKSEKLLDDAISKFLK